MFDMLGNFLPPVNQAPAPTPASSSPPPQLAGAIVSVDESWEMFGIAKKRGTRAEVKKRYLAFVAANHPDRPDAPSNAPELLLKANAAFARLEQYCKW
jgi:hypothetical protein